MSHSDDQQDTKKHAPATLRNREAILGVLRNELPELGTVLEVASGSGEHAVYFAENMPQLEWRPSDPDPEAIASIDAYRAEFGGGNLREPLALDAADPNSWSVEQADAILCINMAHIAPWVATEGLFKASQNILAKSGGPLVLYGPFIVPGVETAPSNLEFDRSLKARNPDWGVRDASDVVELAKQHGFDWDAHYKMPANNLALVFRPSARG